MDQVVLHLSPENIEEDLEYYFSGERDKNNQVRPDRNVYSMTPSSSEIDFTLGDDKVANFFFPTAINSLDRIYIGISVSLYANYWGASFLLQLLKLVKPGGSIILPVYPEGQAAEKGFWSRSFLENIFQSRQLWTGFSNITAENDGVMSLRVGRKWPAEMPSSIEWFFAERSNLMLSDLSQDDASSRQTLSAEFQTMSQLIWGSYSLSASLEGVITDFRSKDKATRVLTIGRDYGLSGHDSKLSPFVSISSAKSIQLGQHRASWLQSVNNYFAPHTGVDSATVALEKLQDIEAFDADVIMFSDVLNDTSVADYQSVIQRAWDALPDQGVLILREDAIAHADAVQQMQASLEHYAEVHHYSALAACQIKENYEISHYSLAVEEKLQQEKVDQSKVLRVLQKTS
jgi:hypothetical protein